jgi:hypothetical protein
VLLLLLLLLFCGCNFGLTRTRAGEQDGVFHLVGNLAVTVCLQGVWRRLLAAERCAAGPVSQLSPPAPEALHAPLHILRYEPCMSQCCHDPLYKLQVLRVRSRAFACLSLCSSVRKLEKNRSGS